MQKGACKSFMKVQSDVHHICCFTHTLQPNCKAACFQPPQHRNEHLAARCQQRFKLSQAYIAYRCTTGLTCKHFCEAGTLVKQDLMRRMLCILLINLSIQSEMMFSMPLIAGRMLHLGSHCLQGFQASQRSCRPWTPANGQMTWLVPGEPGVVSCH